MTEAEWLACTDPDTMLTHLRGKVSDRKLRLFAVACCRQIWGMLEDERSRSAVLVAERFADGLATKEELDAAWAAAWDAARAAARDAARAAAWDAARDKQCAILREIVGNPFRPLNACPLCGGVGAPSDRKGNEKTAPCVRCWGVGTVGADLTRWLTWNDRTVSRLATHLYEERRFDEMPILADALEESGCDHVGILGHLREPGGHARGCWAVDLLIGKE